jgi:integrase
MAKATSKRVLTDAFAKTAAPGLHWDERLPGFLLRVTPAGARSWVLNYRTVDGIERRETIGRATTRTAAQARARAAELKRCVEDGGDPLADERERRAAPTVADLVARYRAEMLPKRRPNTQRQYCYLLDTYIVPALGATRVAEITRTDIEKLHAEISAARGRVAANATVRITRLIFNWAIEWKMRPERDNPVGRKFEFNTEPPRDRYLDDTVEMPRLIAALAHWRDMRPESVDLITLLLLTGARRNEVLTATWGQFDLNRGKWTKPAATTKQKREHRVPLSAEAIALLRRRLADRAETNIIAFRADDPVFPGATIGKLQNDWEAIRETAGLGDVRLHDLRHSYAGFLASNGLSLPVIGALLGHTQPRTTQRYIHLLDEPLRHATGLVGKIVGT